jgi:gluconolactonase
MRALLVHRCALRCASAFLFLAAGRGVGLHAQVTQDAPQRLPSAVVDLRTRDGAQLVHARWRYHDADVVPVAHRAVGPDLKPTGAPNQTFDIAPHAGVAGFDDSQWPEIDATSLEERRSNGRLAFNWYRLSVTIPERIGRVDAAGCTVILEVVVDDYSEVWVDGHLSTTLGATGGGVVRGWNAPNRVVLTREAHAGQTFQIAIFGANGPLSEPPPNYIWIRSATLDFHTSGSVASRFDSVGTVTRLTPAVNDIVPTSARIERVASGFVFTEGPVWHPDGYLLFSDPNANTIYRWTSDGQVAVFRTKSGYAGTDIGDYHQPGSNGLTLDAEGRLVIDEHGRRRVVRLEKNGIITPLIERFDEKRLNSPNDLVLKSDGALYITDPVCRKPSMTSARSCRSPVCFALSAAARNCSRASCPGRTALRSRRTSAGCT